MNNWDFAQSKLDNFLARFDNDIEEVAGDYREYITLGNIYMYREMARSFVPDKPTLRDFVTLADVAAPELKMDAYVNSLTPARYRLLEDYVLFFWTN